MRVKVKETEEEDLPLLFSPSSANSSPMDQKTSPDFEHKLAELQKAKRILEAKCPPSGCPSTLEHIVKVLDTLEHFEMTDELLRVSKEADPLVQLQRELKLHKTNRAIRRLLHRTLQQWKTIHSIRKAMDRLPPIAKKWQMAACNSSVVGDTIGVAECLYAVNGHAELRSDLLKGYELESLTTETSNVFEKHRVVGNEEFLELKRLIASV